MGKQAKQAKKQAKALELCPPKCEWCNNWTYCSTQSGIVHVKLVSITFQTKLLWVCPACYHFLQLPRFQKAGVIKQT
jgi:hypothetical protein